MSIGLIGKKIGMSREFIESGQSIPVTIIKVEKVRVIEIIDKENRAYSAIKLGYFKIKNSKLKNQIKNYFSKKNTEPKKILKEYRVEDVSSFKEGNELGLELLDKKFVDVKSKTIGKGFWGYEKMNLEVYELPTEYQFHTGLMARLDKDKIRGAKKEKMAGHMGDKFRTF